LNEFIELFQESNNKAEDSFKLTKYIIDNVIVIMILMV